MDLKLNHWPGSLTGPVILAVLAAVLYAAFNFGLPQRYNSPDEAANAFFARRLSRGQSLTVPITPALLHPRSTVVVNNNLVPASFLGLPLIAGTLGWIFTINFLPYVTPLAALIGLLAFYFLLKELVDDRTALIGLVLLIFLPSFWYYHSRSFFHNGLFVDLFLLAVYASVRAVKTNQPRWFWLTGLAAGLALSFRTAEIFWLLAAGLIWFGWFRREINLKYVWYALAGGLIGLLPIFIGNYFIYGYPVSFGYAPEIALGRDLYQTASLLGQLILPFGFHPRVILNTIINYVILLNWWWFAAAAAGAVYLIYYWRTVPRLGKRLLILSLLMAVWLIVVYGSWWFSDNPDPTAVTLGTSYNRYFLPFYILALLPAAVMLARGLARQWGQLGVLTIVALYAALSVNLVWLDPIEGLGVIRQNIKRFETTSREVRALIPAPAVIVAGRTDKFFWPERAVIYELKTDNNFATVADLIKNNRPVYNFHATWRPLDLAAENVWLARHNLQLLPVQYGWQDFSLYQYKLRMN